MITLGRAVEEAAGLTLAEYLRRNVFEPLGMRDTGYAPDSARCLPTSPEPPGRVHDPLARAYGDPGHCPGNAGLFSTADDLARFCQALLSGRVLKPETVRRMFASNGDTRGLGWDVYDASDKVCPPGVGHTGYTGTLLWIDPAAGRFAVLLTNRVHPDDTSSATRFRREVLAVLSR